MSNSANPPPNRSVARGRTKNQFETADARSKLVRQIVDAENAKLDARTVKLRALRLAKEEAERAEELAKPKPAARSVKKRSAPN